MLLNSLLSDEHEIVHPKLGLQAESYNALKAPHVLLNSLLSDEHEIVHPKLGLQAESYTALKAPRVLLNSLLSGVHEPEVSRDDSIIAKLKALYVGADVVIDAGAKDEKRLSGSKPMLKAPHVGADVVVDAGAKDEKRLSGSTPIC